MKLYNKFKNAFNGFKYSLKDGSILIQVVLGMITLVVSYLLGFTLLEFIIVILCVGFVIVAEFFNSCIELIVDIIHPEYNNAAKKIKDFAANAVLVAALFSVIVWILLIINKFY